MLLCCRALSHAGLTPLRCRQPRGGLRAPPRRTLPPRTASMFSGPGSEELRNKVCASCNKDTPLVAAEELPKLLAAVPAWHLADNNSALARSFVAKNFSAAIDFFNKVAAVADSEGHHPDLHLTNYRNVEIRVSTHAAGGITHSDFVLCAKLDELPVEYSPKWLQAQQAAATGEPQA